MSEQAYATASAFRIRLKSLLRAEEAGEYAVSASSNAGQGVGVHGQGEAQPADTEPMFGPLDVDEILAEELVRQELAGRSGLYSESAALDSWSGPVDAVALDVSGYGGYAPAEGAAQPPWAAPVAYSSWVTSYGEDTSPSVADPQWNTAGHSLVPGATEYLRSAPPADWSAWDAGDEVPVARRVSAIRPGRSQGR
ncbi:hypothetical protein ACJ6WF_11875 [Streptomyces sp. MMS24-I2-30]|uniref:hypothetical protein n=1 Tax=Streptomyces sp. MMS24-I2-30 TaxID=3351564 RepID=UPI003896A5B9